LESPFCGSEPVIDNPNHTLSMGSLLKDRHHGMGGRCQPIAGLKRICTFLR
jgi:hypothetical protein